MDNLGEIRLEVREALGEQDEDTSLWTNTQLDRWINEGCKVMAAIGQPIETVYQFTTALRAGSTTEYAQEYELPADTDEVFAASIYNGDESELDLCAEGKALRDVNYTGVPTHFYTRKGAKLLAHGSSTGISLGAASQDKSGKTVIGLHPRPNSAYLVTVSLFAGHHKLRTDADVPIIPIEFRRGIVAYACYLAKMSDDAYAEANIYKSDFAGYAEKMRDRNIQRGQSKSFPKVKISDDDGDLLSDYEVGYAT